MKKADTASRKDECESKNMRGSKPPLQNKKNKKINHNTNEEGPKKRRSIKRKLSPANVPSRNTRAKGKKKVEINPEIEVQARPKTRSQTRKTEIPNSTQGTSKDSNSQRPETGSEGGNTTSGDSNTQNPSLAGPSRNDQPSNPEPNLNNEDLDNDELPEFPGWMEFVQPCTSQVRSNEIIGMFPSITMLYDLLDTRFEASTKLCRMLDEHDAVDDDDD